MGGGRRWGRGWGRGHNIANHSVRQFTLQELCKIQSRVKVMSHDVESVITRVFPMHHSHVRGRVQTLGR